MFVAFEKTLCGSLSDANCDVTPVRVLKVIVEEDVNTYMTPQMMTLPEDVAVIPVCHRCCDVYKYFNNIFIIGFIIFL